MLELSQADRQEKVKRGREGVRGKQRRRNGGGADSAVAHAEALEIFMAKF